METHQKHHQNHQNQIQETMSRLEFHKVAICSSLLFFICVSSLISNKLSNSERVNFTFIELVDGKYTSVSFNPETPFSMPLNWYVKTLTNKLTPVVLLLIVLIRPKFPKWIWLMWFIFFLFIVLDWVLFFERWPWRYTIDSILISVQAVYAIYLSIKVD